MRHRWLLPAAVLTTALLLVGSAAVASPGDRGGERVDVIVVLHGGADAREAARDAAQDHHARVSYVYETVLNGYAAAVPSNRVEALRSDPRVASVSPDQEVHTFAQEVPTGVERIFADDNANLGIDGTDDVRVDARVAVIDTGIDFDHADLNVDTANSANCLYTTGGGPPWARKYVCQPGEGNDDNGHGTHVAGTIGAIDNGIGVVGVAPGATVLAVKVLDSSGSGYMSGIIAGIEYITTLKANGYDVDVANMSLGCACSSADLDAAIASSVAAGIVYAVAAGNSDADAEGYSPANHPDVITVSALADFDGKPGGLASPTCRTDEDDTLANFSNWGSTVEIAAPGVCITSTWNDGGYKTISGTSMASPHVAGAAAILASTSVLSSKSDVDGLIADLLGAGNLDWADDSGDGVKEPLLDVSNTTLFDPATVSGSGESGGDGDTTAPAAPTGLSATGGDAQVVLDWADNSDSDLAGYNVHRSTTSGGSYTKINGSLVASSAYTDSSVTNGTAYYYVVTAVDTSGNESASSNEASATPAGSGGGTSGDMSVTEETYSQFGGKTSDSHLDVAIRVTDGSGQGVGSATVTMDLYRSGSKIYTGSATTDSAGYATFAFRNIGPGCYAADVTSVTATGRTWDGSDPDNTSC